MVQPLLQCKEIILLPTGAKSLMPHWFRIIIILLVGLAITGTFVDYTQRKNNSNLSPFDDAVEVFENPPGSSESSVGQSPLLAPTTKHSNILGNYL